MDAILAYLPTILSWAPNLSKYMAVAMAIVVGLKTVVTTFVLVWQGLVQLVQAVAALPFPANIQAAIQGFATKLKADEDAIEAEEGKILPLLDRISLFPLPQKPTPPAT